MTSVESADGTNSLLMKRPVGTVIDLLSAVILTTAGWAIMKFAVKLKRRYRKLDPRASIR